MDQKFKNLRLFIVNKTLSGTNTTVLRRELDIIDPTKKIFSRSIVILKGHTSLLKLVRLLDYLEKTEDQAHYVMANKEVINYQLKCSHRIIPSKYNKDIALIEEKDYKKLIIEGYVKHTI
jgi:hypothetical protein